MLRKKYSMPFGDCNMSVQDARFGKSPWGVVLRAWAWLGMVDWSMPFVLMFRDSEWTKSVQRFHGLRIELRI